MTASERAAFLADLDSTRTAFGKAVEGLTEAQAKFKPSPDSWNVEEIVEHVALAERGMFRLITERYEPSNDPHEAESAAAWNRARDFSQKLNAPERVQPLGKLGGMSKSLEFFFENRKKTIEFVGACQDDLRQRLIQHPVGLVNGQDCLRILAFHPLRHVTQIDGIKAHPAYPR